MDQDIEYVLISKEEIDKRIAEVGKIISKDYAGKDIVCIGILKGCFVFMADIMRQISVNCSVDFMSVSSYSGMVSTGAVKIIKDLSEDISGKDVLIVEDILDSGITLNYLREFLSNRKPNSIKIVTFLDKPTKRIANIKPDYYCFEVPDAFVVGYGLDYNEKYRNLPYIGILKPEIYSWIKKTLKTKNQEI